jgi:hypothetical protein
MRRLGTGTGFACAKLSEVLPSSRALLAQVRMTDFAKLSEVRNLTTFRLDAGCNQIARHC